jgi:hypothetical protein
MQSPLADNENPASLGRKEIAGQSISMANLGNKHDSSELVSEYVMERGLTATSDLPFPIVGPGCRPEIFGFMRVVHFVENFFPDSMQNNALRGSFLNIVLALKVNRSLASHRYHVLPGKQVL